MGMYDYVDYQCDCPYCGEPIKCFQSKDHNCLLRTLHPEQVTGFYQVCSNCKEWVQYDVIDIYPLKLKLSKKGPTPRKLPFQLDGVQIVKNLYSEEYLLDSSIAESINEIRKLKAYILTENRGIELEEKDKHGQRYSKKFAVAFNESEYKGF